jgi:hypothetical protein
MVPLRSMVALVGLPFATGIDSPVSIDWSRLAAPSVTMPSTGTFLPHADEIAGHDLPIGTSVSTSPTTMRAVSPGLTRRGWRWRSDAGPRLHPAPGRMSPTMIVLESK